MNDYIDAVIRTRELGARAIAESVTGIPGSSESSFRDALMKRLAHEAELYPEGWYDPPPGGVAVLWSEPPFARLQFDSLRPESSWPSEASVFSEESVGMVYLSPVHKETGMLGDIGLTLYRGTDERVRNHIRTCYETVRGLAERAEAGMQMKELFEVAMDDVFKKGGRHIGWMSTSHDPLQVNLGHTAPGSYGEPLPDGPFEEVREAIRTRRLYINAKEEFRIPTTCAFTVEARLTDETETMPNTFFHLIVTFTQGKRRILTNFDGIFKAFGMDYMLS